MVNRPWLALLFFVLLPTCALGQPFRQVDSELASIELAASSADQMGQEAGKKKPPKPKPDCLDGVKYDDGRLEKGVRPVLFNDNFVMRFEAASYPAKLEKVCIAWIATSFWKEIFFEIRIWKADGPNGTPGELLDVIPNLYTNRLPGAARFTTYDVKSQGIIIDGPVYLGPYWDPLQAFLVYIGYDASPKTKRQSGFYNVGIGDDHAPSSELGVAALPDYRALGIRANFGRP
jgi:hypothetical protein